MKFEDLEKKLNDTKEILKHISKSLITVEKNSFAIAKDIDNLKIMGEKMKEIIGTVTNIQEGVFTLKTPNGKTKSLLKGDVILKGEVVFGEAINTDLSTIQISLNDEREITLNGTQEQLFDSSLLASNFENEELAFEKDGLDETLKAWNNKDGEAPNNMETASGEEQGEQQDENSFKATFSTRDGASTNVESDLRDKPFTSSQKKEDLAHKLILEEKPVEVKEVALPTKITLTGSEVIEGEDITITATVDNAPETDLIITLSNNEIITIKAGELTGTVTYNSRADDKYIQGDKIENITIKKINYQDIDTTSTATVTVKDDKDITNVSITKTEKISYESENTEAPTTTDRTGKAGRYFLDEDTQNGTLENGITYKISLFGETKKEDLDYTTKGQDYVEIKQDDNGYFVELKITLSGTFDKDISIDQPGLGWADYRKDYILKAGETETTLKLYLGDVDKINDGSTLISGNSSVGGQLYFTSEAFNTEFNLITVNFDERISYGSKIETTKFNISSELQGDNVVFNIQASSKIKGQGEVTVLVNGKSYFVGLDKDGKGTLTLDTNSVAKDGIIKAKIKDFTGFQLEDESFGSTTLILKDKEVTYEIETSNAPDPTKYDFITTFPTATIEVQKNNTTETYTINLNKDGKGTLTLDTTGLTKEPIIKVIDVDGNYEDVDLFNVNYSENTPITNTHTTVTITKTEKITNQIDNIEAFNPKESTIGRVYLTGDNLEIDGTFPTKYINSNLDYKISYVGVNNIEEGSFDAINNNLSSLYKNKISNYIDIKNDGKGNYVELKITLADNAPQNILINRVGNPVGETQTPEITILKGEKEAVIKMYIDTAISSIDNDNIGNNKKQFSSTIDNPTFEFYSPLLNNTPSYITLPKYSLLYVEEIDSIKFNISSIVENDEIIFKIEATSKDKPFEMYSWNGTLKAGGNTYMFKTNSNGVFEIRDKISNLNIVDGKVVPTLEYKGLYENISFGYSSVYFEKQLKYEIQTSNLPDVSKYDFINTFPTADVEVTQGDIKSIHTVNLDKNGKGILELDFNPLNQDSYEKYEYGEQGYDKLAYQNDPIIKVIGVDSGFDVKELPNILNFDFKDDSIDFGNLSSLIVNNEINLKNNDLPDYLLNIRLEDILNITDSKELTILGDEKDNILFRESEQGSWSKSETPVFENDKSFDIYTNTGDEFLKIKVEQPISDGITY